MAGYFLDLGWDVAGAAAGLGAAMLAEPAFGNADFRNSGRSRTELQLAAPSIRPADVRRLRDQLERIVPHFESPPTDNMDREPSLDGLLEPVRQVRADDRILWVRADTRVLGSVGANVAIRNRPIRTPQRPCDWGIA